MASPIGHNSGPILSDGWIARHRSVRDHWLVGHGLRVKPANPKIKRCHSQGEAWEDFTMECRYADGFVENGGKKMRVERGSLVGATSWLAQRWNWTPQTVRTFLDKLEADGMIARHVPGASENNKHVGKAATIITVCNYDKYQRPQYAEEQAEQQTTNNQATNKQQMSNNIYKDNKGTKEQGNKGTKEDRQVETNSVAAREPITLPVAATSACPEIDGLNGATAEIVSNLAKWLNPHVPDLTFARDQVQRAVSLYGNRAVRDGYAQLVAKQADGDVGVVTHKAFFGFVRTAKERESQRKKTKLSRW